MQLKRDLTFWAPGEGEAVSVSAYATPTRLMSPPKDNGPLISGVETVTPGARVPLHIHPHADELIFVLSGSGYLLTKDEPKALRAHACVHVPAGEPHGLLTDDDGEGLTVLWTMSKPGLDDLFRGLNAAGDDETALDAVLAAHTEIYREIPQHQPEKETLS
jgi:quercetin dioxygenase-like cupin family protein